MASPLTLTVELTQTEVFKDLLALITETVSDKRVPKDVRNELILRIEELEKSLNKENN